MLWAICTAFIISYSITDAHALGTMHRFHMSDYKFSYSIADGCALALCKAFLYNKWIFLALDLGWKLGIISLLTWKDKRRKETRITNCQIRRPWEPMCISVFFFGAGEVLYCKNHVLIVQRVVLDLFAKVGIL